MLTMGRMAQNRFSFKTLWDRGKDASIGSTAVHDQRLSETSPEDSPRLPMLDVAGDVLEFPESTNLVEDPQPIEEPSTTKSKAAQKPATTVELTPFGMVVCGRQEKEFSALKGFYETATARPSAYFCFLDGIVRAATFRSPDDLKSWEDSSYQYCYNRTPTLQKRLELFAEALEQTEEDLRTQIRLDDDSTRDIRKWCSVPDLTKATRSDLLNILLNQQNEKGETIFHLIANEKHATSLLEKLNSHHNALIFCLYNRREESPLHYAAYFSADKGTITSSLRSLGIWDINARNINGWTALHFAVFAKKCETVKELLYYRLTCEEAKLRGRLHSPDVKHDHEWDGALDVNVECNHGWTPLCYAVFLFQKRDYVWCPSLETLSALLNFERTRINVVDFRGLTLVDLTFEPLKDLSAFSSSTMAREPLETLLLLVETMMGPRGYGMKLFDRPLSNGKTPLEIAFTLAVDDYGLKLLELFLGAEGAVAWDLNSMRDGLGGRSLVQYVLEEDVHDQEASGGRTREKIRTAILFERHGDLIDLDKIYNDSGSTILHHLVANLNSDPISESNQFLQSYLEFAQERGVDAHSEDRGNFTALHRALFRSDSRAMIVHLLHIFKEGDAKGIDWSLFELPKADVYNRVREELAAGQDVFPFKDWLRSLKILQTQIGDWYYPKDYPIRYQRVFQAPLDVKKRKTVEKPKGVLSRRIGDEEEKTSLTGTQFRKHINLQAPLRVHAYLQAIREQSGTHSDFPTFNDEEAISTYTHTLTPLHYAVLIQWPQLITKLLKEKETDVNARWGPLQETPLQLASRIPPPRFPHPKKMTGREQVIDALMKGGKRIHICIRNKLGARLYCLPPSNLSKVLDGAAPPSGWSERVDEAWNETISLRPIGSSDFQNYYSRNFRSTRGVKFFEWSHCRGLRDGLEECLGPAGNEMAGCPAQPGDAVIEASSQNVLVGSPAPDGLDGCPAQDAMISAPAQDGLDGSPAQEELDGCVSQLKDANGLGHGFCPARSEADGLDRWERNRRDMGWEQSSRRKIGAEALKMMGNLWKSVSQAALGEKLVWNTTRN